MTFRGFIPGRPGFPVVFQIVPEFPGIRALNSLEFGNGCEAIFVSLKVVTSRIESLKHSKTLKNCENHGKSIVYGKRNMQIRVNKHYCKCIIILLHPL